jgi:hypothetical protein
MEKERKGKEGRRREAAKLGLAATVTSPAPAAVCAATTLSIAAPREKRYK